MTQEERKLLLKDLCCRLPYGVKISWRNDEVEYKVFELTSITSKKCESYKEDGKELAVNGEYIEWRLNENKMGKFYKFATLCEFIKPYLRPMSSMTEEEKIKLTSYLAAERIASQNGINEVLRAQRNTTNFIYSLHLDLLGLIEKGLALEAPEYMYKN